MKYKSTRNSFTLKEETFAERNFHDFREFWTNSRKLFPRKILQRLIRESFFSRKNMKNSKFFGLKLEGIIEGINIDSVLSSLYTDKHYIFIY